MGSFPLSRELGCSGSTRQCGASGPWGHCSYSQDCSLPSGSLAEVPCSPCHWRLCLGVFSPAWVGRPARGPPLSPLPPPCLSPGRGSEGGVEGGWGGLHQNSLSRSSWDQDL